MIFVLKVLFFLLLSYDLAEQMDVSIVRRVMSIILIVYQVITWKLHVIENVRAIRQVEFIDS